MKQGQKSQARKVKFGEVVRLSNARSQDPIADGFERYVGLEHLEPGDLRLRTWGNVADGVTFTSIFQPGQVLFGKRRAYQRKVAVADFAGVCSGDIYVLESKDPSVLLPGLLPFICQADAFFEHAVGTSAGSLSPRTNWSSLAGYELTLPVIESQRNITSLLQLATMLVNELGCVIEELERVKRSSILNTLGPESAWRMTTMQAVVESIDAGKSPNASSSPAGLNEFGVLKVSAVGKNAYCPEENKALLDARDFIPTAIVKEGDFLVTRANARPQGVARSCIADRTILNLMLSDKTWRINFRSNAPSKRLILAWTQMPKFRSYVESICSGTEAKNISQEKFLASPMIEMGEHERGNCERTLQQVDASRILIEARREYAKKLLLGLMRQVFEEEH